MLDKKLFVITYDTFNTSPNMRGTAKVTHRPTLSHTHRSH